MRIIEYTDENDRSVFAAWFRRLDTAAAVRVTVCIERLKQGNFSSVKPVGGGVSEARIDYGAGYRLYFGQEGDHLIILLGGGTKQRQSADIAGAKRLWAFYRSREKGQDR